MTDAVVTPDQLADDLAAQHTRFFRHNPHGNLVHSCLIVPEEGGSLIVACPWGTASERRMVLGLLRAMMVQEQAVRYALWSEVWLVLNVMPPGADAEQVRREHEENYRLGDLARDPRRVEAVFTLVVDASGAMASRTQKIIRGKSGGVRRLELMPPHEHLGGDLGDLLPPRTIN